MIAHQTEQKDNSKLLKDVLEELTLHNPDILSALVVSREGLNVASGIPHLDDDSIALIASDLIDVAEKYCDRLDQGKLNRVLLEGGERTTVIVNAGRHAVLAVLTPASTKLGLIALSVRQAADKISMIFS